MSHVFSEPKPIMHSRETNSPSIRDDSCCWKKKKKPVPPPGQHSEISIFSWHRSRSQHHTTQAKTKLIPTSYKLQAAMGPRSTNIVRNPSLDFWLHHTFSWIFTRADIKTPGADFLAYFDISVNIANITLTDNGTKLSIQGSQSPDISTEIGSDLPENEKIPRAS